MVEPAPRDTQEVVDLNPTESSCWALVPQVCSDLPRNREQPGAAYDNLAVKAHYFSVHKHGESLTTLTFNI